MRNNRNRLLTVLMVLAMFLWGASWVSSKYLTQNAHPQVLSFWRFFLTIFFSLPFMFYFKQSFVLSKEVFFRILLSSLFMVIYFQLFFIGVSKGLAGIGGVIVTGLNPLFIFLISLFLFKKQIHLKESIGLLLGFLGAMLILQIWRIQPETLLMSGNFFYFLGAIMWAIVTLSSQYAQQRTSVWIYSFYLYVFSTAIQFCFALPCQPLSVFEQHWPFWANLIFLAIFPSVFSNTVYFFTSSYWGSRKAGVYTFLVPLASVFLSWLILGEEPALFTIIGGILAVIAVYLIQFKKSRQEKR